MSICNMPNKRKDEPEPADRIKACQNYLISDCIQDGNYAREAAANSNTDKARNCNTNQNKYDVESKECNAKPAT